MNQEITHRQGTEIATPEQINKALLASLPSSVVSSLRAINREFIDPEYGYDFEFMRYELLPKEIPATDLMRARGLVAQSIVPADPQIIANELTRMRVLTKSRAESEIDTSFLVAALTEELSGYPADCIVHACRKWTRMNTFWPSWAELKDILDRDIRRRKSIQMVLR